MANEEKLKMKTKIEIIGWLGCIIAIVSLVTLIIGLSIGNDVLVYMSVFAVLCIYTVGGFILNVLVEIYESQEKENNKNARF